MMAALNLFEEKVAVRFIIEDFSFFLMEWFWQEIMIVNHLTIINHKLLIVTLLSQNYCFLDFIKSL